MKISKRLLAAFMCLLMVMSLVPCGNEAVNNPIDDPVVTEDTTVSDPPVTTTEATTTEATTTEATTTNSFARWPDELARLLKKDEDLIRKQAK